jgi:hypothetical protein
MIAVVWVGRMGANRADVSRFAAMQVVATLGNQAGGRTVRR